MFDALTEWKCTLNTQDDTKKVVDYDTSSEPGLHLNFDDKNQSTIAARIFGLITFNQSKRCCCSALLIRRHTNCTIVSVVHSWILCM